MHAPYRLFITTIALTAMLTTLPAFAGWGDIAKQAGDQASKAVGLPYTPSEAEAGIKEVLSMGTDYATSELGKPGGFSSNPKTTLSLPDSLLGLGGDSSGLLSALNGAAEQSVPDTKNVFLDTIQKMTVTDSSAAIGGSENSITRYFEQSSRDTLKKLIKPVMDQSIKTAGVDTYLAPLKAAQAAAGFTGTPFDASEYLTDKTLDGMFFYMADKEKSIRSTGGAGTTDLLKKIF